MIVEYEKPVTLSKGNTTITLALGIGRFNPDETAERNIYPVFPRYEVWLKYEDNWYFSKTSWKYTTLKDVVNDFKKDVYTEEQVLEKIFKYLKL